MATSSGASVRGSTTSASIPSAASCSAAASALPTVQPMPTIVTSEPSPDDRLAERDDVLALRDVAVLERQQVVVEEHDRVVVADRGGHQPLGVGRVDGTTTLRPGTPMNIP